MLGETLEQKRFFEQALAGRLDMLGRRACDEGHRRRGRASMAERLARDSCEPVVGPAARAVPATS